MEINRDIIKKYGKTVKLAKLMCIELNGRLPRMGYEMYTGIFRIGIVKNDSPSCKPYYTQERFNLYIQNISGSYRLIEYIEYSNKSNFVKDKYNG